MLAIISPAKTLDFESSLPQVSASAPAFLESSEILIERLRRLSRPKLAELMHISPALAELNHDRFQEWSIEHTPSERCRPALYAFKGDVYTGFDLADYKKADLSYAQKHLRILSGLYGLLRPLDAIQAYRLEMGTKLNVARKHNLYEFWGQRLTEALNEALKAAPATTLVNLASGEYASALQLASIEAEIITPTFKDLKPGGYKFLSFYGKKARGMMCDFMIRNRVRDADALKAFNAGGYAYNASLSKGSNWVFTRDKPEA